MLFDDGDGGDPDLPPGTPPTSEWNDSGTAMNANCCVTVKFEGPWFTTQLLLSGTIGLTSFLVFSYCRTRWPLIFAPRTKLKGAWPKFEQF